ncbi:hypothetical protein J6590_029727 [Homalodisca vitripennis]|nr:hypothetical protein J6590_029727 [Homalodisca vitripennis]
MTIPSSKETRRDHEPTVHPCPDSFTTWSYSPFTIKDGSEFEESGLLLSDLLS